VSLHNPHDICYWVMDKLAPGHPSRSDIKVPIHDTPPVPPQPRPISRRAGVHLYLPQTDLLWPGEHVYGQLG
jgi:hypothetical protein